MEAEVDKLELMFQKADSDLDYIQYRLEYEIKTNYPDSAGKFFFFFFFFLSFFFFCFVFFFVFCLCCCCCYFTLLKELSAIKSRYHGLHTRFKPIAAEQKETKSRICATFNKTMTLIRELQKQTDLELLPLTEEEKTAAEQLKAHMSDL
uniref:Protein FAM33A n=1 Tax=Sus scrofa TaxID=9823 RepID=A0A8D1HGP3_PIG